MLRPVAASKRSLAHFLAEPVDNCFAIGISQPIFRFVFRRHFGIAEDLVNSTPVVDVWAGHQVRVQLVDAKIRHCRARTMTGDTLLG
jgi:hypothetical protein